MLCRHRQRQQHDLSLYWRVAFTLCPFALLHLRGQADESVADLCLCRCQLLPCVTQMMCFLGSLLTSDRV